LVTSLDLGISLNSGELNYKIHSCLPDLAEIVFSTKLQMEQFGKANFANLCENAWLTFLTLDDSIYLYERTRYKEFRKPRRFYQVNFIADFLSGLYSGRSVIPSTESAIEMNGVLNDEL
jgi:hypothetical protein